MLIDVYGYMFTAAEECIYVGQLKPAHNYAKHDWWGKYQMADRRYPFPQSGQAVAVEFYVGSQQPKHWTENRNFTVR